MMDAAYNSNYQIVQAPGYVMILTEMIHDARIVRSTAGGAIGRASASGWGPRAAAGKATRSSSRPRNFNGKNPFRGSSET